MRLVHGGTKGKWQDRETIRQPTPYLPYLEHSTQPRIYQRREGQWQRVYRIASGQRQNAPIATVSFAAKQLRGRRQAFKAAGWSGLRITFTGMVHSRGSLDRLSTMRRFARDHRTLLLCTLVHEGDRSRIQWIDSEWGLPGIKFKCCSLGGLGPPFSSALWFIIGSHPRLRRSDILSTIATQESEDRSLRDIQYHINKPPGLNLDGPVERHTECSHLDAKKDGAPLEKRHCPRTRE